MGVEPRGSTRKLGSGITAGRKETDVRKVMLGALGAIAIAIMSQGTTLAATHDVSAVTTRERLTPSSTSSPSIAGDSNLSNQNHSTND